MDPSRAPGSDILPLAAIIVISCGLAAPLWFAYRAHHFNSLAESVRWKRRRIPRVRADLCLLACGVSLLAMVLGALSPDQPQGAHLLFSLSGGCILLFQALAAARILRRVGEKHDIRVSSVLAAVFTPLSPIYFQWKLNTLATRMHNAERAV